jgi:hypothetical protein
MQLANFNANHPRHFSEFIKKHVPVSSKEYTLEEIISAPPEADALIVGSDQIWRDVTGINFLNFGKSDTKRIAYAVSAPWPALAEDWFKSAMKYTPKFNAISVREVAGIQTCKKLDREDAVHVLDPVLLHEAEHYLDVIRKDNEDRTFKNEFVLGYFVNIHSLEEIPWDATVGFSKARENDLLTVPMQGAELVIPEQNIYTPSPSGWLNAFNKTECVVTNSYHGALFAIIMRKPFLVFLQGGIGSHQNGRFTSALEPLGLKHRMLELDEWKSASSETLEERMSTPIDWDDVTNRLNEWRQRSETFLEAALNS